MVKRVVSSTGCAALAAGMLFAAARSEAAAAGDDRHCQEPAKREAAAGLQFGHGKGAGNRQPHVLAAEGEWMGRQQCKRVPFGLDLCVRCADLKGGRRRVSSKWNGGETRAWLLPLWQSILGLLPDHQRMSCRRNAKRMLFPCKCL